MSDYISDPLLALIRERGLIDDLQFEEISQEQSRTGKSFSQILADFGLVDTETQLQIMAEHLGTEVVNLDTVEFSAALVKAVPSGTARMYQCVPVADFGSALQIALANPLNPSAVDEISYIVGKEVQLVVADPAAIEKVISKHYGDESESVGDILKELGADTDIAREATEAAATEDAAEMVDLANEVPIVRFVNLVIFQAIQDRASDIHFEPFEDEFKIRYRVGGGAIS